MTAPPFASLSPDHLAALRAVARMDLSHGIAIGQSLGRSASADLAALRADGYVREVASPRKDGTPNHLYTITSKGREAHCKVMTGQATPLPVLRLARDHLCAEKRTLGPRCTLSQGARVQWTR